MFDKSDIRAAVEGGAISADQATRFEAFLKARNDPEAGRLNVLLRVPRPLCGLLLVRSETLSHPAS